MSRPWRLWYLIRHHIRKYCLQSYSTANPSIWAGEEEKLVQKRKRNWYRKEKVDEKKKKQL
jgi:hypothetical protein